jgi:hypothetical protein
MIELLETKYFRPNYLRPSWPGVTRSRILDQKWLGHECAPHFSCKQILNWIKVSTLNPILILFNLLNRFKALSDLKYWNTLLKRPFLNLKLSLFNNLCWLGSSTCNYFKQSKTLFNFFVTIANLA